MSDIYDILIFIAVIAVVNSQWIRSMRLDIERRCIGDTFNCYYVGSDCRGVISLIVDIKVDMITVFPNQARRQHIISQFESLAGIIVEWNPGGG